MQNWTWSDLNSPWLHCCEGDLPQGKSYFCAWEIDSHKHKANLSLPYSERVHLVVCSSRSSTHGMGPSAQGPGDVKCSRGALGGPNPAQCKSKLSTFKGLLSPQPCLWVYYGELGHTGNICFAIPHKESNRNCSHMPIHITFRHSAGTFPLLFILEEIYTPRQFRKPHKKVRNQEPHVEQLLLNFLPAAQLRCWPECFNLHRAKRSHHQRPQFSHTGVMWDMAPSLPVPSWALQHELTSQQLC